MTRKWALTALGLMAAGAISFAADRAPVVHTATVDGIIHPVSSEFMRAKLKPALVPQ